MKRVQITERDICRTTPDYWLLWTGHTAEYFYQHPVGHVRTPVMVHIQERNEDYLLYRAPDCNYSDLGG